MNFSNMIKSLNIIDSKPKPLIYDSNVYKNCTLAKFPRYKREINRSLTQNTPNTYKPCLTETNEREIIKSTVDKFVRGFLTSKQLEAQLKGQNVNIYSEHVIKKIISLA